VSPEDMQVHAVYGRPLISNWLWHLTEYNVEIRDDYRDLLWA